MTVHSLTTELIDEAARFIEIYDALPVEDRRAPLDMAEPLAEALAQNRQADDEPS